jgi:hypothetical protein
MKKIIKFEGFEDGVGKGSGKAYTTFKQNGTKYYVFDSELIEMVKKNINNPLEVEVEQNDKGYWNIKQFYGISDQPMPESPKVMSEAEFKGVKSGNIDMLVCNAMNNASEIYKAFADVEQEFDEARYMVIAKNLLDISLSLRK